MEEQLSRDEVVKLALAGLQRSCYRRWRVLLWTEKGYQEYIIWVPGENYVNGWVRRMGYTEAIKEEISRDEFGSSDLIILGV